MLHKCIPVYTVQSSLLLSCCNCMVQCMTAPVSHDRLFHIVDSKPVWYLCACWNRNNHRLDLSKKLKVRFKNCCKIKFSDILYLYLVAYLNPTSTLRKLSMCDTNVLKSCQPSGPTKHRKRLKHRQEPQIDLPNTAKYDKGPYNPNPILNLTLI